MEAPAHEILPGLWLGNLKASADLDWQRQAGIRAIFNCTKDIPFANRSLALYRIPLDDNLEPEELRNLETWGWEAVFKIAKEHKEKGNPILIHCHAGRQRSAATVAMYLISTFRCTTDEAIMYIKRKRAVAFFPAANFYESIKGFERAFRNMIAEKEAWSRYPRIPLPQ